MQKTGIAVITGKTYGMTNLIILDPKGEMLSEEQVVVQACRPGDRHGPAGRRPRVARLHATLRAHRQARGRRRQFRCHHQPGDGPERLRDQVIRSCGPRSPRPVTANGACPDDCAKPCAQRLARDALKNAPRARALREGYRSFSAIDVTQYQTLCASLFANDAPSGASMRGASWLRFDCHRRTA